MSLAMTAEQESLRETARRFLTTASPLERVREVMATETAHDEHLWQRMVGELGITGLAVPEELGGSGWTFQDLSYVAEECGRALAPSSLLGTLGLAVPALLASGDAHACDVLLPRILSGQSLGTVGWLAPGSGWHDRSTGVQAVAADGGWEASGTVTLVLDGAIADVLLVLAGTPAGATLMSIDGSDRGVRRTVQPGLDQTRAFGRVDLDRVHAVPVGPVGSGEEILRTALDHADVVLASEMVGGAQACLDMSVAYAKVREQFGRPIGSFQAVKHKCAEVQVELEGARAAVRYAAWCAAESPDELPVAATIAKLTAAEAYFRAAADNVQIHGGIGFTWEHDAHLYFKRAKASAQLFGDVAHYRRQLADRLGL